MATILEPRRRWYAERLPALDQRIHTRLDQLAGRLGQAEWVDGMFSAGDLMMVTVLRRLDGCSLLGEYSNLIAYIARGEARPAYQRAFADQLAIFKSCSQNG